jgi:hypothetical protein
MVFDHQMRMMNLLTRMNWEARYGLYQHSTGLSTRLREAANEFVDYLLFIDEAPLEAPIHGSSGFAEKFSAQEPRDSYGRSLRQLDLKRRFLKYPCSYMIYSGAFDALPVEAKEAIYRRMWEILSGREKGVKYAKLTSGDRQAVIEILRDTKKDFPTISLGRFAKSVRSLGAQDPPRNLPGRRMLRLPRSLLRFGPLRLRVVQPREPGPRAPKSRRASGARLGAAGAFCGSALSVISVQASFRIVKSPLLAR